MGRLDLTVHNLELYPPAFGWCEDAVVSPRVYITVDDTYRFRTKLKRNTFSPDYDEKFVIGNTHRLAMIEILVYGVTETSGFSLMREESQTEERLIARTFLAIGRLVQGQPKTRNYYLATIPRESENNLFAPPPRGIAGTITITLCSESLGEPSTVLRLDPDAERQYVERIKRFFLSCAPEDVAMIDPIISHCRDRKEMVGDAAGAATTARNTSFATRRSATTTATTKTALALTPTADFNAALSDDGDLVTLGAQTTLSAAEANLTLKPMQFRRPALAESFEDVIRRLCRQYRAKEPEPGRLHLRLLGLTNLDKKALNTSFLGSDSIVTIVRTPSEVFMARSESLKETVVYPDDTTVEFDVVNPEQFFVHILVLGKNGSSYYEIGRCNVRVATLATTHLSPRHMFLARGDALYTALAFPAVVHLILEPLNFGAMPIDQVTDTDTFYDRLSRFFRRYDPVRVPNVDQLICARVPQLEEFMHDLVVEHGREPGTVRLELTLNSVNSLRESATVEAHRREVVAIVTMGRSSITSATRTVRRFAACNFDESYTFDVVRETDMLRIEIVKASSPEIVYGRVEFTCLNTQRGVANKRKLWLVGAAGTPDAYFSGIVHISMISQEIGHPFEVDVPYENMMAGRLRRYAFRRIPDTIHRVNLAVATVFDMETFMAQLAARYGEEDPTYVIYFTITGCRRLRSRLGGINPYVVARVGVAAYETKWVKDNTEPDFFEFCEFYYDRPSDNAIVLVVMDHSDIGEDREIGHAVIPLVNTEVNTQYNDFVSLISPEPKFKGKDIGAVGFKYTVFDTNLVDHTRTHLMKTEERRVSKGQILGPWVEGERTVPALHATEDGARQSSAISSIQRTSSMRSDDATSRVSGVTAASPSKRKSREDGGSSNTNGTSRWSRWMSGTWNALRGGGGSASAAGTRDGSPSTAHRSRSVGKGPRHRVDLPSGAVSPDVLSRMPSLVSLSSVASERSDNPSTTAPQSARGRQTKNIAHCPTKNLMDGGILSIEEFCGNDPTTSGLPSARTSTEFLADMNESGSFHSTSLGSTSGLSTPTGSGRGTVPALEATRAGLAPQPGALRGRRSLAGAGGSHTVRFADAPSGDGNLRVRVRVLYCRNLANQSAQAPNPYLLLSTNHVSHRTHVEFATLNPQFNREFVMPLDDPYHDALNITVLSDTPFGSRKLGHCVLSLVNVQRGEYRTRWAALVLHSHHHDAVESGSICVSLRGENFGLDLIPAADAENRLRERIRSYLVAEHPEQLHLLEWFVGEYTRKEGALLHSALQRPSRFLWGGLRSASPKAPPVAHSGLRRQLDNAFGVNVGGTKLFSNKKEKETPATIQVTIHDIANLYVDDFLATGSCQVKISLEENGRKTAKRTRSASGSEGYFKFEEEVPIVLKQPSTASGMRFAVTFDGKHKAGMCFASVSDLHRGVAQRRRYMLVVGINTRAPLIAGYLTASILSTEYGSSEAAPTDDEEERFDRLQRFFAYYLPREVATTALTYAATFNVDAYLRKLVEQHGPEPGDYKLRVTVDRCTDVPLSTVLGARGEAGSFGPGKGGKPSPFCIVRCGLQEFHSGVVSGSTEFVFLESFDVTIGLPDRDLLEFILMVHLPAQGRSEEIGRAVVPLDQQVRDESNAMHLPIVHNPGTQHAEIMGSVDIVLFTSDFGESGDILTAAKTHAVFALSSAPSQFFAPKGDSSQPPPPPPPSTGFHPRTASSHGLASGTASPPGSHHIRSTSAAAVRARRQTTTLPSEKSRGSPTTTAADGAANAAGGTSSSPDAAPYIMFDATHAMVKGSPGRVPATPDRNVSTLSQTSTGGGAGGGGVGSGSLTSNKASHGRMDSAASKGTQPKAAQAGNPPIEVRIIGIAFANNDVKPTRDLYLRVSMGTNVLFRTKPMPADALSTLSDGQFLLTDTSEVGYAMMTLKIGINQLVGSGVLCNADFSLSRCAPCSTETRRLRLYHAETHEFLGICRLQFTMPDLKIVNAENPIRPSAVEPLLDDLASLFKTYSRKDLRRISYALYRSTEEDQLHHALRLQLAPSVVGTFYLAVKTVELEGTIRNNCVVEVTVGAYSATVVRRQSAVKGILELGMSNADVQKLEFPLARVDVSVNGDANVELTMRLRVYDAAKGDKETIHKRPPIGSAVVSVRALLSPQIYDMSEPVTVSLVAVDRGKNRAHASLAGSITFRLFPPAFETYPRAVRFPTSAVQTVSRTYVRYYLARIDRFLRHYDPNSLEKLHATVYEQFIQNGKWEAGLPKMLNELINRWGAEQGHVEPPPELPPRSQRIIKSTSRSNLVMEPSRTVLAPAFGDFPGK